MRVLFALLSFGLYYAQAASGIEVVSATRKIDASNAKVTLTEELELKNTGKAAVSEAVVCRRAPSVGALSFFRVVEGAYKRSAKSLSTSPAPASIKAPAGVDCFTVALPSPLSADGTVKITAYGAYSRALTNFPENVTQEGTPKVLLFSDALLASPYKVEKTTTFVKTAANGVDSYGEDDKGLAPVSKKDSIIQYGPYENVEGFQSKPLRVHADFPRPVARASRVTREVTVSPWGNIYIDEEYDIVNDGAKLIGAFSRLRHMVSAARPGQPGFGGGEAARSAIDSLTARLPRDARWAYYRDDIGNISSSNTRIKNTETEIQLSPRFPLYGGWRSVFKFGYSLPFKNYLTRNANGVQRLRLQFASPIADVQIDSYELRVVLPEGATPVFDPSSAPHGAAVAHEEKVTYFDLKGRPVVVFRMGDVVSDHNTWFNLDYRYPGVRMFQAPATIVTALLLLLGCGALLSRLSSLSISKGDDKYKQRQREERAEAIKSEFADALTRGLGALDRVEEDLRALAEGAAEALPAVRARKIAGDKARSAFESSVKEVAARAAPVDPLLRDELERLGRTLRSLVAVGADVVRACCDEGKSDAAKVTRALADVEKSRKALLQEADAVLGEAFEY